MTKTQKVFNGAILTVAMRWSDRLIGLVSMIILARLLVPADFGVVAMAALVVGFIDVLLDLGVSQALIHNKEAKKEDFDTAWSLRLVQATLAAGIIYFCAPLAASYFNNVLIIDVLHVMAISVFIGGLENIGIINFQKEMDFGRDFKFFFYKRLSGFVVTLIIAILFQTFWAMVLGTLAGRIAGLILSYRMHPFRPQFSFAKIKEIWSFSQWVLFKNIGAYFDASMDRLLVGKSLDAKTLGGYTVAGEVASLPTTELLAPIGRVLFPAFVDTRHDPTAFARRISLAIGVQSLVAIPACLGLMFVAPDLVYVLLGEKWMFVAPVIQVLAISNLIGALAHSCGYALLAIGKVKILGLIAWFQATLFIMIVYIVSLDLSISEFAQVRLIVVGVGSGLIIFVVLYQLPKLSIRDVFMPLIRPFIAAFLMLAALEALYLIVSSFSPFMRLLSEIVVGGGVYVSFIYILWMLSSRSDGAESYLVKNILYKMKN